MVPSILGYMPLSVELLGLTAPVSKPGSTNPQFLNHIDAAGCQYQMHETLAGKKLAAGALG